MRSRGILEQPFPRLGLLPENLACDALVFEGNAPHSHHRVWKIIKPDEGHSTSISVSVLGEEIPHCNHVVGRPCPQRFGPTHIEQKSRGIRRLGIRQSLEKGFLNIRGRVEIDHSKHDDTVGEFEIDWH